ncbi:MAG: hypothetical protein U1E59_09840 [Amaricoccus sp.]
MKNLSPPHLAIPSVAADVREAFVDGIASVGFTPEFARLSFSARQPDGKSVIVSMVAMPRSVLQRLHAIVEEGIAIESMSAAKSGEVVPN